MNQLFQMVGKKHFTEVDVFHSSIDPALTKVGLTPFEISKWVAFLVVEDYIMLYSPDDTKTEMFIRMKPKGLSAVSSEYFKEEYEKFVKAEEKRVLEVALIKSTKRVNRFFGVTIILSLAAVAIQTISYFNDREKSGLQLRVKEQQKLIRQLQGRQVETTNLPNPEINDTANHR